MVEPCDGMMIRDGVCMPIEIARRWSGNHVQVNEYE